MGVLEERIISTSFGGVYLWLMNPYYNGKRIGTIA
jgi:hypothetical protein